MANTIAIVGTLDTKGDLVQYLKEQIEKTGRIVQKLNDQSELLRELFDRQDKDNVHRLLQLS